MQTHSIKSIQALRGVAALLVVVFHYKWSIGLELEGGVIGALVNAGGLGVTIFFILSGFIMIYSSRDKRSALDFAINRFSRIYPAYISFIILCFAISGAMSIFHYQDKTVSLISSFFFLPTIKADAPAYIDLNNISAVRWTLNYEMFFYCLLVLSMLFKNKIIALVSIFAMLMVAVPFLSGFTPSLSIKGYEYNSVILSFITNPIMYEFLAGVLIALVINWADGVIRDLGKKLLLLGSALLVVYFCFYKGMNNHGFESSALYLSIFFFSVVLNRDFLDGFMPKFMVYLGEISFSIYLLHNPMMRITQKYIFGTDSGWSVFAVAVTLTLVTSFLSHRYLEVEASRWVKKTLLRLAYKKNVKTQEGSNF